MKQKEPKPIHPFLQKLLPLLKSAGEVVIAPDGHIFLNPNASIKTLWGAMDMKKEGQAAGVRVVVRKVHKRALKSKYAGMPWLQVYVLPIVKKNAQTMTDAERRNMEINRQALLMAHAVERDPEKAAYYHELHEAHKLNPEGYKKLYPNFFGFLVATFRMELEAQAAEQTAEEAPASTEGTTNKGIRLCVPMSVVHSNGHATVHRITGCKFRPFIRLPMVA